MLSVLSRSCTSPGLRTHPKPAHPGRIESLLRRVPLWYLAEQILRRFGQPAGVASFGAVYMQLLLPGLLPLLVFEVARKFLYAQESSRIPPLGAALGGLLSLPMWLALWCGGTPLGVTRGAPVALSCSYATMAVVLVGHIRYRMPRAVDAWPRLAHSRRLLWTDLAGWRHFAATALAALVSLTEWLFWEVTAFRVGRFGTIAFAAYSVAYSLEPVLFMLPLGLSVCHRSPSPAVSPFACI